VRVFVGKYKDRVSAGVYGKHKNAMLRKIKLSELGFETEIFTRIKEIDSWWLDLLVSSHQIDKLYEFQGSLAQPVNMVAMDTRDQQDQLDQQ
jgi:hypothetical protein